MRRATCLAFVGLAAWTLGASAQDDEVQAELDDFWEEVVRSVEDWDLDRQRTTYHPDAIAVSGDQASYATRLMAAAFVEASAAATAPSNPRLAFRFASRVHDANTAHEVGVYRFVDEGGEPFFGGVDSYLVKKDGRWLILVEIQRRQGLSESEWSALAR